MVATRSGSIESRDFQQVPFLTIEVLHARFDDLCPTVRSYRFAGYSLGRRSSFYPIAPAIWLNMEQEIVLMVADCQSCSVVAYGRAVKTDFIVTSI
jgi:hypothetical protein